MPSLKTLILSSLLPAVLAHSWVEQLSLISDTGTYIGNPGYPRGYVARTDPGFDGYSDKYQLPSPEHDLGRTRINSTDLLCHPAQRTQNYTTMYPKLAVTADSYVALRYLENGHVSQPWIPAGKPDGSGTVFIYGTYQPSDNEKMVDVLQWTADGKGGNGKGFLMTAQDFDDGRCHQPNSAPISITRQMKFPELAPSQESWCETDLHIPADVKTGTLTLYWVWSWQTSTKTEGAVCGKDEYYTTCADVDVVDTSVKKLFAMPKLHTLLQQDPQASAVSDYKSRTAHASTPNLVTTEGCSYTTFTTSSLPATLTKMTSLPADFLATYTKKAAVAVQPTPSTLVTVASTTSAFSSVPPTLSSMVEKASTVIATSSTSIATPTTSSSEKVVTVIVTYTPSPSPSSKVFLNAAAVLQDSLATRRALRFLA